MSIAFLRDEEATRWLPLYPVLLVIPRVWWLMAEIRQALRLPRLVLGRHLGFLPVPCARLAAPETVSVPSCCGLTLQKYSDFELIAGRPLVKLEVCSAVLGSWWLGAWP